MHYIADGTTYRWRFRSVLLRRTHARTHARIPSAARGTQRHSCCWATSMSGRVGTPTRAAPLCRLCLAAPHLSGSGSGPDISLPGQQQGQGRGRGCGCRRRRHGAGWLVGAVGMNEERLRHRRRGRKGTGLHPPTRASLLIPATTALHYAVSRSHRSHIAPLPLTAPRALPWGKSCLNLPPGALVACRGNNSIQTPPPQAGARRGLCCEGVT